MTIGPNKIRLMLLIPWFLLGGMCYSQTSIDTSYYKSGAISCIIKTRLKKEIKVFKKYYYDPCGNLKMIETGTGAIHGNKTIHKNRKVECTFEEGKK